MSKLLIGFIFLGLVGFSQTTEAEKKLKKARVDSVDGWKNGGSFAINFSQVTLTNWAAGGANSIAVNSFLNYFVNYTHGNFTWDNNFDLGYGMIKQGDLGLWIKSDDKIDYTSKVGKRASKKWYYAGLLNFRSQFAEGFATPAQETRISDFLSPGYLLVAAGMDYKPNANFTMFVSPLTSKSTFVLDEELSMAGAFGVDPGARFRGEFGGYMRMMYTKSFKSKALEGITYTTKFDVFSNYNHNPKNLDINWENLIAMKINKYLSANFATHMIYDDDIMINVVREDGSEGTGPRLQFKQWFGAGLSVKF